MDAEFGPAALAIISGDLASLQELLRTDPDLATRQSSVGHRTLLQFIACEEPNVSDPVGAARLLIDAGSPTTLPLISAAGCNAGTTLEFLLDADIGPNVERDWTPLDEALYWDNAEMAQLLLDRGAELRTLRNPAGLGDRNGLARFFAADGSLTEDAGPLASPFPDTVPADRLNDPQAIIDHAFVMAVNAACWRGNRDLVQWLLGAGADPTIRDTMDGVGADAISWARHHGHHHLVELLI